jgi:troponin T
MAEEEENYEEEEGEEEEAEAEEAPSQSEAVEESAAEEAEPEAPKEEEKPKPKPPPPRPVDDGGSTKTEAELAMLAQKRKHEEEEEAKLAHYEEQRRIQREKEEEELRLLKEKQERRKREREEEDRILAERKAAEEERRRQEDEERKAKAEADKARKEEEKRKRQALMAGLQASGGPNFEITKKDKQAEKFDKFGNIVKAKAEMGLTKEQQEEQKKKYLSEKVKPLDAGGDVNALRAKIKELHARITRLEGEKYDMEKRRDRQEYDLKELNERQRQISRNKALKKGLNPDEVTNSPHPPKVPVASKYDRQIDRRSYHDRFSLFESPPKPKKGGIHHGSSRPPSDWGRKENEELENLRKNLEPPKYQEAVKIEGARPPMEPIPVSIEGGDEGGEDE